MQYYAIYIIYLSNYLIFIDLKLCKIKKTYLYSLIIKVSIVLIFHYKTKNKNLRFQLQSSNST